MIKEVSENWFPENPKKILDVGCNVGVFLKYLSGKYPNAGLCGIDINDEALGKAKLLVPDAKIINSGGEEIAFESDTFDLVTSFEVIEHIPEFLRSKTFSEISRVLKAYGSLIISVPHKGLFRWLDSNNIRFAFPWIYKKIVGAGLRDKNYDDKSKKVEFHHHFSVQEIQDLAKPYLYVEKYRYAGLFLYPVMDWLSWPFYRARKHDHPVRKFFERIAGFDYSFSYGKLSYGVFLLLKKPKP